MFASMLLGDGSKLHATGAKAQQLTNFYCEFDSRKDRGLKLSDTFMNYGDIFGSSEPELDSLILSFSILYFKIRRLVPNNKAALV